MPLAGHDEEPVEETEEAVISTPMPLAGHDSDMPMIRPETTNFYSHAPRGA